MSVSHKLFMDLAWKYTDVFPEKLERINILEVFTKIKFSAAFARTLIFMYIYNNNNN